MPDARSVSGIGTKYHCGTHGVTLVQFATAWASEKPS
jgi:hypothetical protein